MNPGHPCPRFDLHVHSTCSDGARHIEDIVVAAAQAGLTHVGIADHLRTAKLPPQQVLLPMQVRDYAAHIREAAAVAPNGPAVWAGLEIDFSGRTALNTLIADVPWDALDFVLFEYVQDRSVRGKPLAELVRLRADIPCRVGLAHNDLSRNYAAVPPAELVAMLDQADIFVELCCGQRNAKLVASGAGMSIAQAVKRLKALVRQRARLTKAPPAEQAILDAELADWRARVRSLPYFLDGSPYLNEFFTALAGSKVRLSMGTDSHEANDNIGAVEEATTFIDARSLQRHLVTRVGGE